MLFLRHLPRNWLVLAIGRKTHSSGYCDTPQGKSLGASRPDFTWTSYAQTVERPHHPVGGAIPPTTGEIELSPDTFVRLLEGLHVALLSLASGRGLWQHGNIFTDSPSLSNPYVIQFARYYQSLLFQRTKSGHARAKAETRLTSWVETAGACDGLKPPPVNPLPNRNRSFALVKAKACFTPRANLFLNLQVSVIC